MTPRRPSLPPVPAPLWRGLLGCLAVVVLAGGSCPADELPLPRWSEEEIRAFRDHLSGPGPLLPTAEAMGGIGDLLTPPLSFGPRLESGGTSAASAEILPRLRAEDMNLFLPESLLTRPAPPRLESAAAPTALAALKDVTPEFLAAGAAALPHEYLIDPETLVPEMNQQELGRFLDFHAHDALIKLHVLILAANAKLPAHANLDTMCSGSLAKGTACLLVYPLGEPWRARLFLSKAVHDRASQEFMKETARACVEEALQNSDVHDQLRGYTVELSTRLFWLQKALGTAVRTVGQGGEPLAEISPDGPAAQPAAAPGRSFSLLGTSLVVLGLMAAGGLARPLLRRIQQWRRLRSQNRVWMLPEVETVPRLGGAFTGGGGGMMRYAKAPP